MLKLYEYDEKLANLLALDLDRAVDIETGEILTAEAVNDLLIERNAKIEGCMLFYLEQDAEEKALDAEIKKLTARKKTVTAKKNWVKNYVAASLNGEKFETPRVKGYWRKSESVTIDVPAQELPEEYLRIKAEPDKTSIGAALKKGISIPGASIVVNNNLIIK